MYFDPSIGRIEINQSIGDRGEQRCSIVTTVHVPVNGCRGRRP
ncbi:hypothetical protein QWZ18_17365 [Methylobacterium longum]|uniref:Uncharacterized protein n=1 Tax=Methylobacterium longum TaxID=767694 RepID=A0ABT8ASI4_9HYPH|nr:hypothetical protein [Methylobacterium longum]MDN3572386.1 hypothetical protein [Methylobacterium longum]